MAALAVASLCGLYVIYALLPPDTLIADVNYYHAWLTYGDSLDFKQVLVEYPLPSVLVLAAPLVLGTSRHLYVTAYVAAMAILILGWFVVLARMDSRHLGGARGRVPQPDDVSATFSTANSSSVIPLPSRPATRADSQASPVCHPIVAWTILVIATGPIILLRFDLIPALCVAWALTFVATSPSLFGHLIAWGTAMKLWPIIVISLIAGSTRKWRAWGVYAASGGVFILVSVLLAGWGRLLSPITWQGERGLHSESVAATWVILARIAAPQRWEHGLSQHNSVDFTGPGVTVTVHLITLLSAAVFFWMAALTARLWRNRVTNPVAISLAIESIIGLFIVTDKVFSPQYMIWILPAWTAMLSYATRMRSHRPRARWLNTMTAVLIAITVLTQLVYPTLYPYFLSSHPGTGLVVGSGLVAARNVILTLWVIAVARAAWAVNSTSAVSTDEESGRP